MTTVVRPKYSGNSFKGATNEKLPGSGKQTKTSNLIPFKVDSERYAFQPRKTKTFKNDQISPRNLPDSLGEILDLILSTDKINMNREFSSYIIDAADRLLATYSEMAQDDNNTPENALKAKTVNVLKELINIFLQQSEKKISPEEEVLKQLPDKAPKLYSERPNKKQSASDFLKEVWGDYLDAGVLFQCDLRSRKKGIIGGLDPQLMQAIVNECRKMGVPASKVVPTKTEKINMEARKITPDMINDPEKMFKLSMTLYKRTANDIFQKKHA